MKKLNWGILGLGSIATTFIAENAQIYAVSSSTIENS